MMPKEDRKAMLLRLFNDDTPLQNMNLLKKNEGPKGQRSSKQESDDVNITMQARGNTSSPEPMDVKKDRDAASEDEDEGGVSLEQGWMFGDCLTLFEM